MKRLTTIISAIFLACAVCCAEVPQSVKDITREAWTLIKAKDFEGAYRLICPEIGNPQLIEAGGTLSLARICEEGCASLPADRAEAARLYLELIAKCPNPSVTKAADHYLDLMQVEDDVAEMERRAQSADPARLPLADIRLMAMQYDRLSRYKGRDADTGRAIALYRAAVDRGDAESANRLALLYFNRATDAILALEEPVDLRLAADLLLDFADKCDYPPLKRNAAIVCLYGLGTKPDAARAQRLNSDFVALCRRLGVGANFDIADFILPDVPAPAKRMSAVVDGSQFDAAKATAADAVKFYNAGLAAQKAEDWNGAVANYRQASLRAHPLAAFSLRPFSR